MNNETGSGLETIQKAWQSVLEPTLDKADPFVLDLRGKSIIVATESGWVRDLFWSRTALVATTFCVPGRRGISHLRDYAAEIKCTRGPFLADVLWHP